jgi:hypothetical protein
MPMPTFLFARLGAFRAELHACFTRRADALFELGDALLCAPAPVPSLPHLSLEPVHQRGWGSVYAALARGDVDAERLRDLLVRVLPAADPPVFAVDVTTWARCDAECSPERGYYYHPSRHSAGQPIIAGWAWQWICQLSFERDSWTAPVDARRLHPWRTPTRPPQRRSWRCWPGCPLARPCRCLCSTVATTPPSSPWTSPDAPAAVLVRLRSDRCFYADPPSAARSPRGGRPRRHGAKFACADSTTWPAPTATLATSDDRTAPSPSPAGRGCIPNNNATPAMAPAGPVRSCVARSSASRSSGSRPARGRPRCCGCGAGPGALDLDQAWRAYTRRFDLEMVCTQVTKPRLGAAGRGRDHVADLHPTVGHHHPIDQQLHQLAALLEVGLAQTHGQRLQHPSHGLGDAADLDQPLTLGGDLPLACQQVGLLPGKGPA